jgi:hypothetical protein
MQEYAVKSSPRITTGHEVHSRLANTYSKSVAGTAKTVGLIADFLTTDPGRGMELTTVLNLTDNVSSRLERSPVHAAADGEFVIETNLLVAAKFRLPPGHGVVLIQSNTVSQSRMMGVAFLFAAQQKAK